MRVLVACEFSGAVRDAFIAAGHDAVSCDTSPSETPGEHIQCDVREILCPWTWDLLIAFPPCTHLCGSGARWWQEKQDEQQEAIRFVKELWNAPVPRIAIENPVGILSTALRKPDQIIQPWQFGHAEIKTTCLWLKNLPPLQPKSIVRSVRDQKCWKMPPGANRSRERSRTYAGIAAAMAAQWPGEIAQRDLFAHSEVGIRA